MMDLPQGSWRIVVIQELLPSRDGEIRGAILRATSRRGKPTTLKRPVQKLFPLEASVQDPEGERQTPTQ